MGRPVRLEIESAVASIILDSEETGPHAGRAFAAAVADACEAITADERVRAVVLISGGGGFCTSGAHLRDASADFEAFRVAAPLSRLRQPVVAGLAGAVLDQGLELALAADLRVASPDARFAMRQVRDGGFPFDGGSQRLPRIAGPGIAADMLLTGRELDAGEALRAGLISEIADDAAGRAGEIARAIAGRGLLASSYTKEAVLAALDLPFEQGARLEADLGLLLHGTAEREEGLAAFRERRAARTPGAPGTMDE